MRAIFRIHKLKINLYETTVATVLTDSIHSRYTNLRKIQIHQFPI